jgi:hypothetical protein
MIELKKEINALLGELGRKEKYSMATNITESCNR